MTRSTSKLSEPSLVEHSMIISHKHKFIFLKTTKTAGTSLELALATLCGPSDILPPLSPEDERQRAQAQRARNYRIPLRLWAKRDFWNAIVHGRFPEFKAHSSAQFVKNLLSADVWNNYFKFCVERNPWDKAISRFYWEKARRPVALAEMSFDEWLSTGGAYIDTKKGFDLYSLRGQISVDRVFRYEELEDGIDELTDILGLPERPCLPRAKSGFRPRDISYRDYYSQANREYIAKLFAREIAHFRYQF